MPTKRQQIMTAVGTRLGTITLANGYVTNLGTNVSYWHDLPLEYAQEALVYRDESQDYSQANRVQDCLLHVELEAVVLGATRAGDALSDLIRAIGVDATWGGLAVSTQLVRDEIAVETDGREVAQVLLQFDIAYRTPLWQP